MTRIIAHIDMDAFFAAVERVLDPGLEGRPLIIGGDKDSRGVVCCASYEARKFGVHSAMPMAKAARLCPDGVFIRPSQGVYSRASRAVNRLLGEFSPRVEPVSIDESFVDFTGMEKLFGSPEEMARRIRDRALEELRLPCSVGIGTNRLVAKVASGRAKPRGVLFVEPGGEAGFMAPLPVKVIPGVGEQTYKELSKLGVETAGGLARLGPVLIEARFGAHGLDLYERALGRGGDQIRELEAPAPMRKSISKEHTFGKDVSDPAPVRSALARIAAHLGRTLRHEGRLARKVGIKLRTPDFSTTTPSATLAEPTDEDGVIYESGLRLLDEQFGAGRRTVRLIGLRVSDLDFSGTQLNLFDTEFKSKRRELYRTMDKVNKRFGPDTARLPRDLE